MSDIDDCRGDAAAYALGALDPAETERFRSHLERCAVCRDELSVFGHVVDALPMTAPQQPVPKALRRRVMRELRAERDRAAREQTRRHRSAFSGRFATRPAFAGGLLAAFALAAWGAVELAPRGASGVRVIQASVTGLPGSAQLHVSGGHAELVVNHLPPPPAGRIYEVWIRRGAQRPAPTRALFDVTAEGGADVGVPGSVRGVSAILVTQEPAGGSLVPTHAPVIVARLT